MFNRDMYLFDMGLNYRHVKRTCPRNSSMVELWKFLGDHDATRKDADLLHRMDMPHMEGSHFQKLIRRTHNKTSGKGYTIEYVGDGSYKVTPPSTNDEEDEEWNGVSKHYILSRNMNSVCCGKSCKCFCKRCGNDGLCFHAYTCTCKAFTQKVICKHQHLLTRAMIRENEGINIITAQVEEAEEDTERPVTNAQYQEGDGVAEAAEGMDTEQRDVGDQSTVTGPEGPENANEDVGDVSTLTGFENVDVDAEGIIQEWGDNDDGNVAQVASNSTQKLDTADINIDNFDFWKNNTLACIAPLTNLVNELPKDNEGIRKLKQIRNMRLFESMPTTTMPKPRKNLLSASRERTHQHQEVSPFPRRTIKKINTKRKKGGVEERRGDTMHYIDEGLKKPHTDDVWGELTHSPDAKEFKEILMSEAYTKEDRGKFMEKLKKAGKYWECVSCAEFSVEAFGDGKYILCPSCKKWCHWDCSGLGDEPSKDEEDAWVCKNCPGISRSQRVTRKSKK